MFYLDVFRSMSLLQAIYMGNLFLLFADNAKPTLGVPLNDNHLLSGRSAGG